MTATPASAAAPGTAARRDLIRIVTVGHVDHGKSTLIGRLFHDTDSLPEGRMDEIAAVCKKRGMPFEWAFLTDALQAERDQGITIDVAEIWMRTKERDVVFVDAPGHREFIRNMITGAARADAALLTIDAEEGVRQQTRLHGYLIELLGLRQLVVVVTKMDRIDCDRAKFEAIRDEYTKYLDGLGLKPAAFVPISGRDGDNLVNRSDRMTWYDGPTVIEAVNGFDAPRPAEDRPLRLPLQGVYKFDHRRILAGRIESGRLAAGDRLVFSPSGKTATVRSIEVWPNDRPAKTEAGAGESVGLVLDDQIFVERGEVAHHEDAAPHVVTSFKARLFWLNEQPLRVNDTLKMSVGSRTSDVLVIGIDKVIDADTLSEAGADATLTVPRYAIAEVSLRTKALMPLDDPKMNASGGRLVLTRDGLVVGCGLVQADTFPATQAGPENLYAVDHAISADRRAQRHGHRGGVLWFTGLSGAGKSTIAMAVEREMFARGWQVFVLDGDNVRQGLNSDLGFSADDRAENIRRIGEVAALFADAGFLVMTAFISPYQEDRDRARVAAGESFREVYVKADVDICEKRDIKGLYARARRGEIKDFTGISAPYEPPVTPDFVVDTEAEVVERSVERIVEYAIAQFRTLG